MKSILSFFYSTRATLIFLLLFALSMAVATFVEDHYDTPTAYKYIYGAKWFEFIMLILVINFIANIKRYNLLSQKKLGGFLFHSAFILMIIGAGATRYFGYEGLMHIREGGTSNVIVSPENVLKVLVVDGEGEKRLNIPLESKVTTDNEFNESIDLSNGNTLNIKYLDFYPQATVSVEENTEGGLDCIKLNVLENGKEADLFIVANEISEAYTYKMSYRVSDDTSAIRFFDDNGHYYFVAPITLASYSISNNQAIEIPANTKTEIQPLTQYLTRDEKFKFIFNGAYKKARPKVVKSETAENTFKAFVLDVNINGKNTEVPLALNADGFIDMQKVNVPGVSLLIGYGEKELKLPFSIRLNDFILDRYPGSSSPSSYASEVTILDSREGAPVNFKIYMNHVLDHGGFRFFQSSYDKDEHGSILSVNHDFWGTWITYFSYALLTLGFIWNLFSKYSRFQILSKGIAEIRKIRLNKTLLLACVMLSGTLLKAQVTVRNPVSAEHAERLGKLIVQTVDGRSEPLHTLAYDVMHKMTRKDKFDLPGKGNMDAMQVFIDMLLDPTYWKDQKIIYVRETAVAGMLGIDGKYASIADLTDASQHFKLSAMVDDAFRKKAQDQSPVDKELIKVGERFEIYMMLNQGSLMKIFPEPVANSTVWVSWDQPQAQIVIEDRMHIAGELGVPQFNYNNFMGAYLNAAYEGCNSHDFTRADKIVDFIENVQRSSALADFIPSKTQVDFELYYNKAQIFTTLRNIYGILAIFLLVLAYWENFAVKRNKIISGLLNFFLVLLGLAFAYHTYGMGLRWYLSGHAPWSNGYEALLLVGWAGLLAGFSFIRYSKIPVAATALLAFFTLMTAGHSSYDPQITNLQPVLKSYWLVIHVATLTISYGFLGLAFILGLIIMSMFLVMNTENYNRLNLMVKELSHINEMNMTIGLMLATVGTFLGGVWANESWGRYWGWDAKETWALIIVMTYSIVIHLRLVDKLRGDFYFTVGSILAFSSVLMTFIGVNYYLSKGMHSYAAGETPIFPIWAWIAILSVLLFIFLGGRKEKSVRNKIKNLNQSEL